jgi:hypothetical protein
LIVCTEREALEDYLELARQGHHFVIAEAPTEAEVQRALPALRADGGHKIHHYGKAVITDLAERNGACRSDSRPRAETAAPFVTAGRPLPTPRITGLPGFAGRLSPA